MRSALCTGTVALLATAAALAFAAAGRSTTFAPDAELSRAVGLNAASPSARYRLVARIDGRGAPMLLQVSGLTADFGRSVWLHLKVSDRRLADGTTLRGPELDDLRVGGFVYVRTPLLNAFFPPTTWIRYRADRLHAGSDQYKPFQVGPRSLLALVRAADGVRAVGPGRFRGRLDPASSLVGRVLDGVAGGLPFTKLRIHVALRANGTVRSLRLIGAAPAYHLWLDARATFTPTRHDRIEPPDPGFVFDQRLLGTEL
jgi:hypothetical protein